MRSLNMRAFLALGEIEIAGVLALSPVYAGVCGQHKNEQICAYGWRRRAETLIDFGAVGCNELERYVLVMGIAAGQAHVCSFLCGPGAAS